MSRSDQWIGLNAYAQTLLETRAVASEAYEEVDGAWMDVVGWLHRHTLDDGSIFEEYMQDVPWQSGPMYFVALRTTDGKPLRETLWTDKELEGDGGWFTWTHERAYYEVLAPLAEEADRYRHYQRRRDPIGVTAYQPFLDGCLATLAEYADWLGDERGWFGSGYGEALAAVAAAAASYRAREQQEQAAALALAESDPAALAAARTLLDERLASLAALPDELPPEPARI